MFSLGMPALPEILMFGFQGGEAPSVVARKEGYMKDAQQKWNS
jgi:hypothetical protein